MRGPAAFGARRQLIAQTDVGQRSAHHHFVIAAARAVGIEIPRLHAVLDQVFAGGAVGGNIAGGRDVIGGDRIAQHRQHAQAGEIRTEVSGSTMLSKYGGLRM